VMLTEIAQSLVIVLLKAIKFVHRCCFLMRLLARPCAAVAILCYYTCILIF